MLASLLLEVVLTAANPFGVAIGPDGALYVCEVDAHRIVRIDPSTKAQTVVATGNEPYEMRFDRSGGLVWVDMRDAAIYRDGRQLSIRGLRQPHAIEWAADGALLICDTGNHRVVRHDPRSGVAETWSVTGNRYRGPRTFARDPAGPLYLALREGNAILKIDEATGAVEQIASVGPKGMAFHNGALYLADTENHRIQRLDLKTRVLTTVAEGLKRPHGVWMHDNWLYIGDSENHRVLRLRLEP
ncbi:MAG: NHL repeat-containing protein [Bryobacteraceae bacterium]|nr:NHL repeat-containing protein [Bryobacteraceae bacterium]